MIDLDSLRLPAHPRSARYDPAWMVAGCMGPNPLWLLEDLLADLPLRTGDRVLDLGCGQGLTSVFLAREYGVQVFACDLWVKPAENLRRFTEAGVDDRVFPLHAEARDLKFAKGFFDAAISVDSYQYYGTDALYLSYLAPFVRKGGYVGIAVPGLQREIEAPPEWLLPYWESDFAVFHSADWWRSHWTRPGQVEVISVKEAQDAVRNWRTWSLACAEHSASDFVRKMSVETVGMLDADAGRTFAFPLLVARV
jgi:cyclopropane fatty-acyl-phospholipid synthase-like methyltransferase